MDLRDTPHAIAGGAAIGMFFGFLPILGLKTVLCLSTAWLSRCSKLASVVVVSLHDLLMPIAPVLMRFEYDLGYWLLSHPHKLPAKLDDHHMKLADMLKWTTFLDVGLPLLVGAIVTAIPFTVATYVMIYAIVSRRASGKSLSPAA